MWLWPIVTRIDAFCHRDMWLACQLLIGVSTYYCCWNMIIMRMSALPAHHTTLSARWMHCLLSQNKWIEVEFIQFFHMLCYKMLKKNIFRDPIFNFLSLPSIIRELIPLWPLSRREALNFRRGQLGMWTRAPRNSDPKITQNKWIDALFSYF